MRVTLYTKEGYGLCEEAEEALRRAQKLIRFDTEIVYIEDDPALSHRYCDRVPVIVVGGEEVASAPVDETHLLALLSAHA